MNFLNNENSQPKFIDLFGKHLPNYIYFIICVPFTKATFIVLLLTEFSPTLSPEVQSMLLKLKSVECVFLQSDNLFPAIKTLWKYEFERFAEAGQNKFHQGGQFSYCKEI